MGMVGVWSHQHFGFWKIQDFQFTNTVILKLCLFHYFLLKLLVYYRGRLQHGRHFTFMSATNDSAITLVSPTVNGSIADERHPFAAHGLWLQVLLAEDFIEEMCLDLDELDNPDEVHNVHFLIKMYLIGYHFCFIVEKKSV